MRNGKFITNQKALVCALALILATVATAVTLAFVFTDTDPIENEFESAVVTTAVTEKLDGDTKENVAIKNTGDTEAYIRAAVVLNWKDQDQNIFGATPTEGTDYSITYHLAANGWVKGADGYYYYTKPVAPGESTDVLIVTCTPKQSLTIGDTTYYLSVDIVCSGVQSTPTDAVLTHWQSGVSGVNGNLLVIKDN